MSEEISIMELENNYCYDTDVQKRSTLEKPPRRRAKTAVHAARVRGVRGSARGYGMKVLDRRIFLKYCIGSAAALGLDRTVVGCLERALAADDASLPAVIWLACANCTGCTVSFANHTSNEAPTDIGDLLLGTIGLAYHPNLMGAAGQLAVDTLNATAGGSYVLVVEGGVPTAFGGHTCTLWTDSGYDMTASEAVTQLATGADAVLAVGTCASFGGIPAGAPNPTGIVGVRQHTGLPAINIPGCPTHPEWVVWTVAHLLAGVPFEVDGDGRPKPLFEKKMHDKCPFKEAPKATTFGQDQRCLKEIGCWGPDTKADCQLRRWNGGTSWCIEAGSLCIGCTDSGFPDSRSPFFGQGER
jgi:hydrogenase small subunit